MGKVLSERTANKLAELIRRPHNLARASESRTPAAVLVALCGEEIDTDPRPHYYGTLQWLPDLDGPVSVTAAEDGVLLADVNGNALVPGQVYGVVAGGMVDGWPVFWADAAGAGGALQPLLAEIVSDDGETPPVHTAKRKTRDTDNTVIDYDPAEVFEQVLNPLEEAIPAGTLVEIYEIADQPGWWWADPVPVAMELACHLAYDESGAAVVTPLTLAGNAADTGLVQVQPPGDPPPCPLLAVDVAMDDTYTADLVESVTSVVVDEDSLGDPVAAIRITTTKRQHYWDANARGLLIDVREAATAIPAADYIRFEDSETIKWSVETDGAGGTGEALIAVVDRDVVTTISLYPIISSVLSLSGGVLRITNTHRPLVFGLDAAGMPVAVTVGTDTQSMSAVNLCMVQACCDAESLSLTASASPASGEPPFEPEFHATPTGGVGPFTFLWGFGDEFGGGENTSTDQNPTHAYELEGEYEAVVMVTDACGKTATASVFVTAAAVVESTWDCVDGSCVERLDGTGAYATQAACETACAPPPPAVHCRTYSAGGSTLEWSGSNWTNGSYTLTPPSGSGPGSTGSGTWSITDGMCTWTSATWDGSGTEVFTLASGDAEMCASSVSVSCQDAYDPCYGAESLYGNVNQDSGSGLPLTVNYTSSPSGGVGPYTYAWVFDGGTPSTSTAQNPTVVYYGSGEWDAATLDVTDACDTVSNNTGSSIHVDAMYANVGQDANNGGEPLTVHYTCDAMGGTGPFTYDWVFPGGSPGTSTSATPAVTYSAGDWGAATCTLTDAYGNSAGGEGSSIHVEMMI